MTFPLLKSGAIAQYPSERRRVFSTFVNTFLDGSEQRYPQFGSSLKRWVIRLEMLDEAELVALEQFFISNRNFSFTDPWDGTVHPNCSFDHDEFAAGFIGLAANGTSVIVRENR